MWRPVPGQQRIEFAIERRGQAFQNVGEIDERIEVMLLAGLDETVDHRGPFATGIGACKHPVLASHDQRPDGALGDIVIDGEPAVLRVAIQGRPLIEGVLDRLTHRALR